MALTVTPDVAALRADLAPHTVESIAELIGPVAVAALDREQSVPALRATETHERGLAEQGVIDLIRTGPGRPRADASAAAVLLRAFVLGTEVTRAQLDRALPRTGTAGCARLGLVEAAGNADADAVRALVDLQPYAAQDAAGTVQWWLASDRGELATGRSLRPDHVLGVGGASLTLARATVRDPRRRVLDLGTGCGIQALHATRHSAAVVGTDVSARALRFAAFNAALAGVAIELREGSMLEPVAGETFDLVVSNPPFVITPRAAGGVPWFEYRDGGLAGDDVVRGLVTGVGAVLEPGGVAQLLANWEHRRGQDWRDRVGEWLDVAALDSARRWRPWSVLATVS